VLDLKEIKKLSRGKTLWVFQPNYIGSARILGIGTRGCSVWGVTTFVKSDTCPVMDETRFKVMFENLYLPFE
jgi:hypothetical protein